MRAIIGLDIDDVLWDFKGIFLEFYNKEFSTHFKISAINGEQPLSSVLNITDQYLFILYKRFFLTQKDMIIPFPEAVDFLTSSHKYDFVFISHRQSYLESYTEEWIRFHFDTRNIRVHCISSGRMVPPKGLFVTQYQCDYFVEDNFEVACEVASCGITVFLLDKPWNTNKTLPKGMIRIFSLTDINFFLEV